MIPGALGLWHWLRHPRVSQSCLERPGTNVRMLDSSVKAVQQILLSTQIAQAKRTASPVRSTRVGGPEQDANNDLGSGVGYKTSP